MLHGQRLDSLLNLYEQKVLEKLSAISADSAETGSMRVVEVPFTSANGVTKVDCTINGLPLNFIFDTGASDVTISQTEANFMFKNGYLRPKDIVGKQRYGTADGSVHVGTVCILNHINFGGLELTGVQASVVANQKAPLLLGQTVLKRLGKIEKVEKSTDDKSSTQKDLFTMARFVWKRHKDIFKGVGIYHITFVLSGRRPLLGQLVNDRHPPRVEWTSLGGTIARTIEHLPLHYQGLKIIAKCIMPDHIHLVLHLYEDHGYSIKEISRGLRQAWRKDYMQAKRLSKESSLSLRHRSSAPSRIRGS